MDLLWTFAGCSEELPLSVRAWYASSWRAQFYVLSEVAERNRSIVPFILLCQEF